MFSGNIEEINGMVVFREYRRDQWHGYFQGVLKRSVAWIFSEGIEEISGMDVFREY